MPISVGELNCFSLAGGCRAPSVLCATEAIKLIKRRDSAAATSTGPSETGNLDSKNATSW